MAKDKKVEQITDMEVDFAQWFTDVCTKAQLIDYSSVKGVFIYRPYGYAIWENIQTIMDKEFKKQGVENVYMPLLIPESLLQKEKDHVEGFAPECAWVTMGGGEKLEERYAIRPTSETLFCEHFANVLQSHRDLPMKYNQWCSVLRWEKTSRPHQTIYVVTPEMTSGSQLLFRDNIVPMIRGKHVLILAVSVATGGTVKAAMEAVKYYGGEVTGVASIFSTASEVDGYTVNSVFNPNDLPGYFACQSHECPLCKEGKKIDALINCHGFSKL